MEHLFGRTPEKFNFQNVDRTWRFELEPTAEGIARIIRDINVAKGKEGTKEALVKLLTKYPQVVEGNVDYLLTSGLAVELFLQAQGVEYEREHHDIDVCLLEDNTIEEEKRGVLQVGNPSYDTVTAEKYWADMCFAPKYLADTAREVEFDHDGIKHQVKIVHPAIIFIQKISDAFDRSPRDKDWKDAAVIWNYYQELREEEKKEWKKIFGEAVEALPDEDAKKIVYRRFEAKEWKGYT